MNSSEWTSATSKRQTTTKGQRNRLMLPWTSTSARVFRPAMLLVAFLLVSPALAGDWPEGRGPNRDGVWHETALVDKFAGKRRRITWRQPINSGYSGLTVAD